MRRTLFILLAAVLLGAVAVSVSLAQIVPYPKPDAGVKGTGAIALPDHGRNVGLFDVNVAKSGNALYGGFRYTELSPARSAPVCTIISRVITGLRVEGNLATVAAIGYWNGRLSDITVTALDDNPSGDNFHITARPRSPLTIIYDEGGGLINGDLVVYSNTQPVLGYAKGAGAIKMATNTNMGRFTFAAEMIATGARGYIYYIEYGPTATSAVIRPPAAIYVPAIDVMRIDGNTATMKGKGTFNGMPAAVEVTAVDNSMLMGPIAKPDYFSIKAETLPGPTLMPTYQYAAEGPLAVGDITVVAKPL